MLKRIYATRIDLVSEEVVIYVGTVFNQRADNCIVVPTRRESAPSTWLVVLEKVA